MAEAKKGNLPIFYNDLIPLNSKEHGDWNSRGITASFAKNFHAIPVTTDEFVPASRFFPIIFSANENPVPLALLGMNEGVNLFVDDEGQFSPEVYMPAYIRRYPFMLARINPGDEQLSLCFDPTAGGLGKFDEGQPLFDEDGKPGAPTEMMLKFCEQFEQAGARTQQFTNELQKLDLLMEGEVAITMPGREQPFIYRGFKMVQEEKLRELRGDELRKLNKSGALPLIHAHLFSLQLMREMFARQTSQGKTPNLENVTQEIQETAG